MKKSGRDTSEGVVQSYIHAGNKLGALVELKCETDFVAKTEDFIKLAKDLAMQVAGMAPTHISKDDEGASEAQDDEILLSQSFIKDPSITIEDMVKEMISKVGENIKVSRIIKFDLS
jgi:elongation factor Ts